MTKYAIRSKKDKNKKDLDNEDHKEIDPSRKVMTIADGIPDSGYGFHAAFRATTDTKFQLVALVDMLHQDLLDKEEIISTIAEGITLVNKSMVGTIKVVKEYENWGTTLDACVIYQDTAYIGHVGDSRVYHIGNDCKKIKLLTQDHVTEIPDIEKLPPKHQRIEILNAKITNYVGKKENIIVDTVEQHLEPGDMILMVTDGYAKALYDNEILRICRNSDFLNDFKRDLIEQARARILASKDYAKYKGIEFKKAYDALDDDRTFVAIKRLE